MKSVFSQAGVPAYLPKLLSAGFGIILLSWLISQVEWSYTVNTIRHIPLSLLLLAFVCYGGSFYLRAIRFKLLLPSLKKKDSLFHIILVHYTALNIVPARLGELSYVYLVKKVYNVPTGFSVSSLVLARVFDQIAISLLFLLSTFFVDISSAWMKTLTLLVTVLLFLSVFLLILLIMYKEYCASWLKRILQRMHLDRYRLIQRGMTEIDNVVAALADLPRTRSFGAIFGLSVCIWICIFTVNFLLFQAFHVPLSYIEVVLASTFMILLTLLPIQVLSGIGIRETAWIFIAGALHVSRNVAITAILGSRIVSILFLAAFGMTGFLGIRQRLRKKEFLHK